MDPRPLAVIAAAVLVLPACGNGDSPDEAASPTAMATAAAEPTETEQARPAGQRKTKPQTYRVQRGDSLSEIAARFDTTVGALVRLNGIKDRHHIRIGQELKIPGGN